MTDIVATALESFGTRALVDGPEVFLNSNAAQGFALIMQELATNAAKHGALTVDAVPFRFAGLLTLPRQSQP